MRILNLLQIVDGIPTFIKSFPIYEDQLSEDVIEQAELTFLDLINKHVHPEVLSDEEQEILLKEGRYEDDDKYRVYLIWSDIM